MPKSERPFVKTRITADLNERATQMLNKLCEWRQTSKIDVLREALVIYHFIERQRNSGKDVRLAVFDGDDTMKSEVLLP